VKPGIIKASKARELALENASKHSALEEMVKPLEGRIKANAKKVTAIESVINQMREVNRRLDTLEGKCDGISE
jgi:hypothetical protein